MEKIEVHETAFVTSTFRSYSEELSRDNYSRLWNNAKTNAWIKSYLQQVSEEEPFTHCIRNRYFLDKIKNLVSANQIEYLINIGCGFSMYPFLLDESILHVEVDKPEIIKWKQDKVKQWMNEYQLPTRNIHYIGFDLNGNLEPLIMQLAQLKEGKSSFILIEGVLFFLERKTTDYMFQKFTKLQSKGEYIGSVSYDSSIEKKSVFKRLLTFFKNQLAESSSFNYQTIDDEYYKNISGYCLIDKQDYFSLSSKYSHSIINDADDILNENYYILQRINY